MPYSFLLVDTDWCNVPQVCSICIVLYIDGCVFLLLDVVVRNLHFEQLQVLFACLGRCDSSLILDFDVLVVVVIYVRVNIEEDDRPLGLQLRWQDWGEVFGGESCDTGWVVDDIYFFFGGSDDDEFVVCLFDVNRVDILALQDLK